MPRVRLCSVLFFLGLCTLTMSQPSEKVLRGVDIVNHKTLAAVRKHFKGKAILVNVWATWCDPCKREIPALLKLREGYSRKGLEVIFVSADDPDDLDSVVLPTLKKLGVDFLTFINRDSTDEAFINGMDPGWSGALPSTFLYNRKGALVDLMVGERSYEQFDAAVRRVLRK